MLIGREVEVAEVARLLSEDRAVAVVGEAGVGKTALLRAVAGASGRRVAEGGALATLSWLDYLPLQRALGRPVLGGDSIAVANDVETAVADDVLLLDDLHWADAGTLEVVSHVAGRVGLLTGVRRGTPGADAVIDRLCAAGFTQVSLSPLGSDAAAGLVRALRPDLRGATVEKVIARCGGNPLLLRELTVTGEPTESLRLAMAARLRDLDQVGRDAFAMLALAGRPLAVADLGAPGVKSLLGADLVAVSDAGVQVRHALLAEVLIDGLAADERRALHATLARVVTDDGEAARHFQLAGQSELAQAAAQRAAQRATRPGERARHLAVAATCASGAHADDLCLAAARALEDAHDWDEMTRILDRIGADNRPAQAWACLLRARGAWTAGDAEGLRRALEQGLALVDDPDSEIAIRLRIEYGRVPVFIDADLGRGVSETAAALELARASGVDIPRAQYLYGTALAVADRPGCVVTLEAAIAAARAVGDTATEFLAANNLASFHESADEPAAARALCLDAIDRARELGLGDWEQSFAVAVIGLDFHAGRYEQMIAACEDLVDTIRETRGRDTAMEAYCLALIDTGRIDEALRRLEGYAFSNDYRGTIEESWVRAEAALWGGSPAAALEHIERCLSRPEADPNLEFFHSSRAWARFDLGIDPGPAPIQHPRAMLWAIRPEVIGMRQLHLGENVAAAATLHEAAELFAPFHVRGEVRCLWAAAEATRRAGDTGSAVALLVELETRLQALGMLPLLARTHRSLRAAGVRRSAPRTRTAGDLLTGRQRQVLTLVGDGLTNAQIAQRLGISRHTVVSQLASSVAKLGANSRAHAAALAAAS